MKKIASDRNYRIVKKAFLANLMQKVRLWTSSGEMKTLKDCKGLIGADPEQEVNNMVLANEMIAATKSLYNSGQWDIDKLERYKDIWLKHPCLDRASRRELGRQMDAFIAIASGDDRAPLP